MCGKYASCIRGYPVLNTELKIVEEKVFLHIFFRIKRRLVIRKCVQTMSLKIQLNTATVCQKLVCNVLKIMTQSCTKYIFLKVLFRSPLACPRFSYNASFIIFKNIRTYRTKNIDKKFLQDTCILS